VESKNRLIHRKRRGYLRPVPRLLRIAQKHRTPVQCGCHRGPGARSAADEGGVHAQDLQVDLSHVDGVGQSNVRADLERGRIHAEEPPCAVLVPDPAEEGVEQVPGRIPQRIHGQGAALGETHGLTHGPRKADAHIVGLGIVRERSRRSVEQVILQRRRLGIPVVVSGDASSDLRRGKLQLGVMVMGGHDRRSRERLEHVFSLELWELPEVAWLWKVRHICYAASAAV